MIFTDGIEMEVDCSVNVRKAIANPIIYLEIENNIRTTSSQSTVTVDVLDYTDNRISNSTISVPKFETKFGNTLAIYEHTVNNHEIYSFTVRGNDGGGNIAFSELVNCTKVQDQLKVIVTDPSQEASMKITFAKNIM